MESARRASGKGKGPFFSKAFRSWKDLKVNEDLEDFMSPPLFENLQQNNSKQKHGKYQKDKIL
jgi:hypothetical protein